MQAVPMWDRHSRRCLEAVFLSLEHNRKSKRRANLMYSDNDQIYMDGKQASCLTKFSSPKSRTSRGATNGIPVFLDSDTISITSTAIFLDLRLTMQGPLDFCDKRGRRTEILTTINECSTSLIQNGLA